MKILLINNHKKFFEESGPAYQELLEAAKLMEEVHVIVYTKKSDKLSHKKIGNIYLYPTNSKYSFFYIFDAISIVRAQLTHKFHLIVDLISGEEGLLMALNAYLISWKYGKNFIVGVHQHPLDMEAINNAFVSAIKKDLLSFLYKRSSGIRVLSESVGEELYSRMPELANKIYILPFINDIEKARFAIPQVDIHKKFRRFKIILIHASRSVRFTNLLRAQKVIKLLKKRYPKIGLVVIGRIKFSILNWPQRLFFLRGISFGRRISNLSSYYRTANAFIDTSIPKKKKTESKLLREQDGELVNAVLAGCPVVAADTPQNQKVVRIGDNGFLVDPNNTHLFAKKIIDILEEYGLREHIRFERFNISEVYGKSLEGYTERLTGIWEASKSVEEVGAHIPRPASPLSPERAAKSQALTIYMAERVKQKIAHGIATPLNPTMIPKEGDNTYIVDLDDVKENIDAVIKELENEPEKNDDDVIVMDIDEESK